MILVDLELTIGYGSNKNWVGFFERKTKFKKEVLLEAISFFLDFFENEINDFIIATSYYVDSEKLISKQEFRILKDVLKAEIDLINQNYINTISFNEYFDCDDIEYKKRLSSLNNKFIFLKSNKNLIKKFSLVGMGESHLGFDDGHCFFVSIKNNIIIYPHGDNTGYGCFIIDKDKDSVAFEFLKKANELKSFRSNFKVDMQTKSVH